ncbi:hypothetical protein B7760_01494 [Burkholderia glumae]|nr:hypothetical protein B7760_01494 [Burkholderia glumae]
MSVQASIRAINLVGVPMFVAIGWIVVIGSVIGSFVGVGAIFPP